MNKAKVRTRYAPSPTGLQHPGGIRTALFAWLFAKTQKGDFLIRIEDTDKAREIEGAEKYIYESLAWLGIEWNEGPDKGGDFGPYKQSERLNIYKKHARILLDKGMAYADPFTKEDIEVFRKQSKTAKKPFLFRDYRPENPPQWRQGMPLRFRTSELKSYSWEDESRGTLTAGPEALDDFILLKSDGYPTYNFANVIDDHLMKISHVLRGEEYIASIPKYLSLYEAFGWSPPINVTMPLVLGPSGGKKLSKRDGSLPILEYRELGYLPEAMNNFLATLGWNDGTMQEVYTKAELIDKFELKRLQKAPARFDTERLNYLNGVHLRKLDLKELDKLASYFWPATARKAYTGYRKQALSLVHERLRFLSEIPELTGFFFTDPEPMPVEKVQKPWLEHTAKTLEGSDFSESDLEEKLRSVAETLNIAPGKLFMAIRLAVTGSRVSPGLFETLHVLGKESTLKRLRAVLRHS